MGMLGLFGAPHPPNSVWTDVPSLGIRMHARVWEDDREAGRKPPIILVHGLSLSSRYMVPLGQRLAALGFDVLAPDLPGFGRSPAPANAHWPAGPNVREQADHLLAWMDASGIRSAVLFGNSVGVQVVVDAAARFPDRVERLVLVGPTPDPAYRTPGRQYPQVVRNMIYEAPSLNSLYQADYASAGVPRMVEQLYRTVDDAIEAKLPKVTAPTLVVRGRFDQTLSQKWAEEFTGLLPAGKLVVVEGAPHNVHYSAPHVMARLMESFLAGTLDGPAIPARGDVVVPGPDDGSDPLSPSRPMSTRLHGAIDYLTAAACLSLSRRPEMGRRTRQVLAMTGASGALLSLFTDYEYGAVRKVPMVVHLNVDSLNGMGLMIASATWLRREPAAGRWAVAALGAYAVLAASATRKPMGPARLVRVRAGQAVDRARRQPVSSSS